MLAVVRVRRALLLTALFGALLATRSARAMSCIDTAYEHMDLERTGVFLGARPVAPPPELGAVDELMNSAADGKGVLLWEKATMGFGKFYNLAEGWPADPAIAPWLDSVAASELETACGYSVPYTPILPGRYAFDQEHLGGERTSKGVDDPEVLVAPGRDRIELRFSVHGKRYRAEYAVRCAYFDWDRSLARSCARSVASPWPASVAEVAAPEASPASSAVAQPTEPAPAPSISVESVPATPGTSPDPRRSRACGSCVVGTGPGPARVAWALALGGLLIARRAARHRMRRAARQRPENFASRRSRKLASPSRASSLARMPGSSARR